MIDDELIKKLRKFGIEKQRRGISSKRRQIVYNRDGGKCRYCGKRLPYHEFHLDHIKPRYWWGNDYVFNLCLSCPKCNMDKGANKNIVPKPLGFDRKIYEIVLIIKYKDFPKFEDFI